MTRDDLEKWAEVIARINVPEGGLLSPAQAVEMKEIHQANIRPSDLAAAVLDLSRSAREAERGAHEVLQRECGTRNRAIDEERAMRLNMKRRAEAAEAKLAEAESREKALREAAGRIIKEATQLSNAGLWADACNVYLRGIRAALAAGRKL